MAASSENIGRLADYAREVMREYMSLMADDEPQSPGEQNRLWEGFRVSARQAARQFKGQNPELFGDDVREAQRLREEVLRSWLTSPPRGFSSLAELATMFDLVPADVDIFIMVAAPSIAPSVEQLYAYVRNDVHKRWPDVGFVCDVLAMGNAVRFEMFLERLSLDSPLRRNRLVLLEHRRSDDDRLDINLIGRRIRASDRVIDFIRRHGSDQLPTVDESLAQVCVRVRKEVRVEDLSLPDFSRDAVIQLGRSRVLPVALSGPDEEGNRRCAMALAGPFKSGLLCADLSALLNQDPDDLEVRLAEIVREAKLGGDLVYLFGTDLPSEITGPTQLVLERALPGQPLVIATERMPIWLARITIGWPTILVPLPDADARTDLWHTAFAPDARRPSDKSLQAIARRFELSASQIQQAAVEARRLAQLGRRRRVELTDLDRACRQHFAHQLGELANRIPVTTFGPDDLILPENENAKFAEILLYAAERESIFADWGYGEKFPYGRGLSILFFGPPGTGKTLGAMIIASALGLDLFRVDLSQILSRYVGETEKNLARVFDEAERGKVMLLFDEADSLFTKRTDVQTSIDRYANLEVAYLLQRMENFDGITVLTTNVEHLLDDAFKRRLRYRIYFPEPEADLRAALWRQLLPKTAPVAEDIPWSLLGEQFEIAGGHIKQCVLRAAVFAKRDGSGLITLEHLIEAGRTECRELGMLVSDRLPKRLERALLISRGESVPPALEQAAENERRVVARKPSAVGN